MKLALVIPGFQASSADWCIPAFTNLARELSDRNEVHVFALRYPHRREDYTIGKVRVHALGGGQVLGKRLVGVSLAKLWTETLSSIVREHSLRPFDAAMGIWATESGWLATQAARKLGLPSLVHVAGGELVHLPPINYGYLGRGLDGVLLNHTIALADRLTAPSRPLLEVAAWEFPGSNEKTVRWPLGVDTDMFNVSARPHLGELPIKFVSVGSLIPVKNQTWILRAFADLRRRRPDLQAQLVLVGDGPLGPYLQHLTISLQLTGYVTFMGDVPHDRLPAVFADASAFVLGSWHEAQCMAALEGMSCGRPWIAPPVGALADIGRNQERSGATSGMLVGERSIYALSHAMEIVAELPQNKYHEWSANAAATVRRDYDLVTQTERLERLLARLTQLHRG